MKKGISSVLVFIILIVGIIFATAFYYYFSRGADFFLIVCNKNREEVEKAVSVFSVAEDIRKIQGELNPQKVKLLNDYFSQNIENPECKLGGKLFVTNNGKVFCNLHGFGDRIPKNKDDFIPFPEKDDEYKEVDREEIAREKRQKEIEKFDKEIEYTSKEDSFYIKGMDFYRERKYYEAIGNFQQAIRIAPEELKYYEGLIYSYNKIGDHKNALKYSEYYLQKNNRNSKIKSIYEYIKGKQYFDLRLKKVIDKQIKISYLSYSLEKNAVQIKSMLFNGDKKTILAEELKYGDYTLGDSKDELIYADRDNIMIKNLQTDEVKKVFNNSGFRIFNLNYSPLSRKILFSCMKLSKGFEIYTVNRNGSELLKLTQNSVDDFPYDFSPNGTMFVYATGKSSEQDINIMGVDATRKQKIVKSIVREDSADWAPTRNAILFSSYKTQKRSTGEAQRDIFKWESSNEKSVNITNSTELDEYYPNWSSDNNKIAFAGVDSDGFFEIYTMNTDGKEVKKISNFKQKKSGGWDYYREFKWYLEDSLLVFSAGFENNRNIYLIEINTGKTLQLTDNYNDNIKAYIMEDNSKGSSGIDFLSN